MAAPKVVGYVLDVDAEYRAAAEARAALQREAAALEEGRAQVARLHAALPAVLFHRKLAADGTTRLIYRDGDIEAVTGWPAAKLADAATMAGLVEGGEATPSPASKPRCCATGPAGSTGGCERRTAPCAGCAARRAGWCCGRMAAARWSATCSTSRPNMRWRRRPRRPRPARPRRCQEGRAQMERLQAGLPAVIFHRDVAADGSSVLLHRGGDLESGLRLAGGDARRPGGSRRAARPRLADCRPIHAADPCRRQRHQRLQACASRMAACAGCAPSGGWSGPAPMAAARWSAMSRTSPPSAPARPAGEPRRSRPGGPRSSGCMPACR
ncbi:hypothetical protein [Dankookia sp. P2]|uniref:hypothetical protein n=1 Tax=Dankookia sp. P2 TaxID=3423955 RepID=UPI003D67B3E8